jgi:ankyrin repeat protein
VRKRGIDLRGFTLSYDWNVQSGCVLWKLMGGWSKDDLNLDLATYYATKGKLTHLDEVHHANQALTKACEKGYLKIVKCSLAAGADKEKAVNDGWTPLIEAADKGHVEIVRVLLAAGTKKDKITAGGKTALSRATSKGHQEIVQLLQPGDPQ